MAQYCKPKSSSHTEHTFISYFINPGTDRFRAEEMEMKCI